MQSTLSRNLRRTSSQSRILKHRCTSTLPSSETARSELLVDISRLVCSQDPLGFNIDMKFFISLEVFLVHLAGLNLLDALGAMGMGG